MLCKKPFKFDDKPEYFIQSEFIPQASGNHKMVFYNGGRALNIYAFFKHVFKNCSDFTTFIRLHPAFFKQVHVHGKRTACLLVFARRMLHSESPGCQSEQSKRLANPGCWS